VKKNIKVRFAPSPTGELHLGGVRTALFNWLFARHNQGQFLLRIEDTDKKRSLDAYTDQIKESLKWLGLDWDGEVVYQSLRNELYQAAVKKLINSNHAFRCFCSPAELEAARKAGQYNYSGICKNLKAEDIKIKLNQGMSYVMRLKIPAGITAYKDLIYGDIKVKNKEIDDFILTRSDGSPTYNLVVVVDDHEMGITHVIRGEDHVSNTAKQLLIYKALHLKKPIFAHLPMILGPDKKRLSKRHGAPGVQTFSQEGYLPISVLNYMALLGWNPGTEAEIFSREELVNLFDLKLVQKKSAVWDEKKLYWISGQQIMKTPTDEMLDWIREKTPEWGKGKDISFLIGVIELLKVRAKSLLEFQQQSAYFFEDPTAFDEKASGKRWKDYSVNGLVQGYIEKLKELNTWSAGEIENLLRSITEEKEISTGKLIHPVRLGLTGVPHGPSLFALMELLGSNVCLRRLEHALHIFPQNKETQQNVF